jgi:hypothetical protein
MILTRASPDDYGWPELCHHVNVVRQFKDLRLETLAGISDPRFELSRVFIVFLPWLILADGG